MKTNLRNRKRILQLESHTIFRTVKTSSSLDHMVKEILNREGGI